ncbi:hypothetical protein SY2F82_68830 [Streptomyces sp. Y2F8-2]|uniref:RNA polymerase sigma factor n=1 Tax=Streptomyces sp. Y2F8-2 TaxID=2759675 RepID=UPI0019049F8C|nr:hypothetical protein SY2F82_68830 [Streptomyces sp. Y2F8-2]
MNGMPQDAGPVQDAVLTRAAQAGDVSALAQLLERHRPGMRAVAVSLLEPGADVDDVMQDAALVALRRIVDIRDLEAVGPWLRMVVRNSCRTLLRASRRVEPVAEVPLPPDGGTPEQVSTSRSPNCSPARSATSSSGPAPSGTAPSRWRGGCHGCRSGPFRAGTRGDARDVVRPVDGFQHADRPCLRLRDHRPGRPAAAWPTAACCAATASTSTP